MTDETKKAPWKRCSWCGERVWNDPIDWTAHRNEKDPVCPAILRRMIVRLHNRLEEWERGEAPAPTVVPAIDFGAIEEPDEDDAADGPEDPDEQEVPDVAPVFEEVVGLHVAPAIDDYDDEDEDEDPAPISQPVMR